MKPFFFVFFWVKYQMKPYCIKWWDLQLTALGRIEIWHQKVGEVGSWMTLWRILTVSILSDEKRSKAVKHKIWPSYLLPTHEADFLGQFCVLRISRNQYKISAWYQTSPCVTNPPICIAFVFFQVVMASDTYFEAYYYDSIRHKWELLCILCPYRHMVWGLWF